MQRTHVHVIQNCACSNIAPAGLGPSLVECRSVPKLRTGTRSPWQAESVDRGAREVDTGAREEQGRWSKGGGHRSKEGHRSKGGGHRSKGDNPWVCSGTSGIGKSSKKRVHR